MTGSTLKRGMRIDADFAIEFGGYLADATERFLDFLNKNGAAGLETDCDDVFNDHWRGLRSAIYEFRKRAAKARAA